MDHKPIGQQSLGNHEFDDGVAGLVPFIDAVKFPVLASNLDLAQEPTLAATHLNKSVVLTVQGRKIGVVGYLTTDTKVKKRRNGLMGLDVTSFYYTEHFPMICFLMIMISN